MFRREAETDRRAVVHQIEAIPFQAQFLGEGFDDIREVVEGVIELADGRHRAVAVAGIVRGNDMVPVRQRRDQVAEHVRRGGESVQQQEHGRIGRAGLPVEDVEAVHLDGFMHRGVNGSCGLGLRGVRRGKSCGEGE